MATFNPNQNFESSFTQILNRTQQNLNRINQRYASNSSNPPPNLSSSFSGLGQAMAAQPSNDPLSNRLSSSTNIPLMNSRSLDYNNVPNGFPSMQQQSMNRAPSSSGLRSSANNLPVNNPAAASAFPAQGNAHNAPTTGPRQVAIDEDVLQSIVSRLNSLEKFAEEQGSYNMQFQAQEKLIKALDSNINDLSLDIKDLNRSLAQQQNRLTVLQSVTDSFSLELEQKKLSANKLETWMRDTEIWREEMNSFYSNMKKQEFFFQRYQKEISAMLQESYLTRQDFENFRDKVYLLAQQSVSTALSAWNDSNEQKIKELERQIAVIKLAQTKAVQQEMGEISRQTVAGDGELGLNPDLLAKVLGTPIPSEMVIKGAVSTEVRNLESSLESKLENRLLSALQNELNQSRTALVNHINHQVLNICTDSLLYSDLPAAFKSSGPAAPALSSLRAGSSSAPASANPPGTLGSLNFSQLLSINNNLLSGQGGAGSHEEKTSQEAPLSDEQLRTEFERRVLLGKQKMESLERKLGDRIAQLEKSLTILAEKHELSDKSQLVKAVQLENKLETQYELHQQTISLSQQKISAVETALRDNELRLKELVERNQQSTVEKLHSMNNEFMNERLSLERRLMIVEKIAQESLEAIKHNQEILNQSILAHPTIQSLSASFKEALAFMNEFAMVKEELRSLASEVLKLSSQSVNLSEFLALKDRLLRCDAQVSEKLPELVESTKRLLDFSQVAGNKHEHYDFLLSRLNLDLTALSNKADSTSLLASQVSGSLATSGEEVKLVKARLTSLEGSSGKDLTLLKDLSGSLAAKLQTFENKLVTINRTQSAETNNVLQHIKLLEEKLDFYEKCLAALQRQPPAVPALAQQTPQTGAEPSPLAALNKSLTAINVAPLALLSSAPVPLSAPAQAAAPSPAPAPAVVDAPKPVEISAPAPAPAVVPSPPVEEPLPVPAPAPAAPVAEESDEIQPFEAEASFAEEEEEAEESEGPGPGKPSFGLSSIQQEASDGSLLRSMSLLNSSTSAGPGPAANVSQDIPLAVPQSFSSGRIANEWDEDDFDDDHDEDGRPKTTAAAAPVARPTDAQEDEGARSESSEDDEDDDEDEKLMASLPAQMEPQKVADKDEEAEEEEDEDEADEQFDQLTEAIRSHKFDDLAADPRPSALENSFDSESTASPLKPPAAQPSSLLTGAGRKALEEEDEFEFEVDDVLQAPAPATSNNNTTKAAVPPLALNLLGQPAPAAASRPPAATASFPSTAASTPMKPGTAASEASDWDASLEDLDQQEAEAEARATHHRHDHDEDEPRPSVPPRDDFLLADTSMERPQNSWDQSSASLASSAAGQQGGAGKLSIKPVVPRLSLDNLKKEEEKFLTPPPSYSSLPAPAPAQVKEEPATKPNPSQPAHTNNTSSSNNAASLLENSFDESFDQSTDLLPPARPPHAPVPAQPARATAEPSAQDVSALEINTSHDALASHRGGRQLETPQSLNSSVVHSPATVGSSSTPNPGGSSNTQAIRERLRARQEALKQQRSTSASSSSLMKPIQQSTTTAAPAPAPAPATLMKKPSILDTLDDDSFSSNSTAPAKPAATAAPVVSRPQASQPPKPQGASHTDEVQSFDMDDSSFDF